MQGKVLEQSLASSPIEDAYKQHPTLNPALRYVFKMHTHNSRRRVYGILEQIAVGFGFPGIDRCPWERLEASDLRTLRDVLEGKGKARATVKLQLALLKGVALESLEMGLMSRENYSELCMVKASLNPRCRC